MKYADADRIYQTLPLDFIPWNSETPPDALIELVEEGKVRSCWTVDLGCGAGTYALYLAGLGFAFTCVDSSPTAIKISGKHIQERGARCRFIVADLLGDLHKVTDTFDFVCDWEFLHHLFPEDLQTYIRNVHKITIPGATCFSVCFSEEDFQFGGSGKYRETRIGTTLYFSSEPELRDLVFSYFRIRELKTIEVGGKFGSHGAICLLARHWQRHSTFLVKIKIAGQLRLPLFPVIISQKLFYPLCVMGNCVNHGERSYRISRQPAAAKEG